MEVLRKLIEAINEYRWEDAYDLTFKLENELENILLYEFGEPNKVSDDLKLLRIYLRKRIRDNVKSLECRRIIARLMRKLSPYGLGICTVNGDHDLATTIETYIDKIDKTLLELCSHSSPDYSLGDHASRAKAIEELRKSLSFLRRALRHYRTDRAEVLSYIEKVVMPAIDNCLASLSVVAYDYKNIKDFAKSISTLTQSLSYLVSLIRYPENADIISEAVEEHFGVRIARGKVISRREKEKAEVTSIGVKTSTATGVREAEAGLKKRKVEFDWVDAEWMLILQHPRIYVILGHRGSGKSCSGHAILEYLHYTYNIKAYFVNAYGGAVPAEKRKLLPEWIQIVNSIEEVDNNSVVLIDEAYLIFHARTSMREATKRVSMDKILELSRQKNISLIFITQRSTKLDKNIIEATDTFIIRKIHPSQIEYERANVKKMLEKAYEEFKRIPPSEAKRYCYVVAETDGIEAFKMIGMPSYWSEELSRFYEGW